MKRLALSLLLLWVTCGPLKAAEMKIIGDATATNITATNNAIVSKIGVNQPYPYYPLDVVGDAKIAGLLTIDRSAINGHNALMLKSNKGYESQLYLQSDSVFTYLSYRKNDKNFIISYGKSDTAWDNSTRFRLMPDGTGNVYMKLNEGGGKTIVGGTGTPATTLDVNGALTLRDVASVPLYPSHAVQLYSTLNTITSGSILNVKDALGNITRLNSHASPLDVDPQAQSSFSDPHIELPFSFQHQNTYLGKGQVVDMAKLVDYVEKKMKSEMGEKNGKLVYTYDLPASMRTTVEQYNKMMSDYQAKLVLEKLENMPMIKVDIAADGKIPDAALEQVPEYTSSIKKIKVTKKQINFETRRMMDVTTEVETSVQVPTGRIISRLRDGWEMRDDGLYRKPALNDVNLDAIVTTVPQLPKWILDRIKTGQQTSMDVKTLAEQIRQMLAEKPQEGAVRQTAENH